jgi:leader peptidase (prepilin peptidase) / N-methyltransferase
MEFVAMPEWLWLTSAFLFGLVFGSFGNVVIWRLPRGESLSHPDSHCPVCETPIAWHDNVPLLSWLLLRGRCRSCGTPISPRYPTVELISAVLWMAAAWRFGMTWSGVAAIVFFYVLLLLAFIDWDTMRLPNSLVLLLFVVGAVGVVASHVLSTLVVPLLPAATGLLAMPAVSALAGALSAAGITLAISLVYSAVRGQRGYGMGDVKLLAVIGVYLGLYALMAMFFATLAAAVYGVSAARNSEEGGRLKFAFGPFLVAGAIFITMFGPQIWAWYRGLAYMSL